MRHAFVPDKYPHYDLLFSLLADSAEDMVNRLMHDPRIHLSVQLDHPSRVEWPIAFEGQLRRQDAFLQRIMIPFNEIFMSFDTLRIAPELIRRISGRGRVSPSLLVRYHMDAYLNEAYILHLRLDNFAVRIAREYRKDRIGERLKKDLERILPTLKSVFAGIVNVRGRHVHQERYDDPQLRSMWLLEHLSGGSGLHKDEFATVFKNVKRDKVDFLFSTSDQIGEVMDRYCRYYVQVLFGKKRKLKIPRNIAAA